jgi:hypothetical protein
MPLNLYFLAVVLSARVCARGTESAPERRGAERSGARSVSEPSRSINRDKLRRPTRACLAAALAEAGHCEGRAIGIN